MARERTGTVFRHGDHWDVRVTLDDGSRPVYHLPAGCSEAMAREKAKYWSENAKGLELRPKHGGKASAVSPGETVSDYFERWNAARDVRGLVSVHKEASTFKLHIEPIIGTKPIASVTRANIEAVVE